MFVLWYLQFCADDRVNARSSRTATDRLLIASRGRAGCMMRVNLAACWRVWVFIGERAQVRCRGLRIHVSCGHGTITPPPLTRKSLHLLQKVFWAASDIIYKRHHMGLMEWLVPERLHIVYYHLPKKEHELIMSLKQLIASWSVLECRDDCLWSLKLQMRKTLVNLSSDVQISFLQSKTISLILNLILFADS